MRETPNEKIDQKRTFDRQKAFVRVHREADITNLQIVMLRFVNLAHASTK